MLGSELLSLMPQSACSFWFKKLGLLWGAAAACTRLWLCIARQ